MTPVAVVIPTFNRAGLLRRAVESVLRQTAAKFCQIVVVDDGSTDETPALVRSWNGRVRYIRQPHAGAAAARNVGIRATCSEFVAFLDSDDEWLPDKTARQLELMRRWPQAVLITGRSLARYSDGSTRPHWVPPVPFGRPLDFAPLLFERNFMPTPSVMVRRSALEQTGLFCEHLPRRHDYHLWVRLACRGPGIYLDALTAVYADDTPAGLSRDKPACLWNKLRARRLLATELRRRPDCRPIWRRGMADCLAILRDQAYRDGRYLDSLRFGVESFFHRPWPRAKWEWRRLLSAAGHAAWQALRREDVLAPSGASARDCSAGPPRPAY